MNHTLFNLMVSGVSMRRAAIILGIHRTTVKRKLTYLAQLAQEHQNEYLNGRTKVTQMQFDDLITIEHTKCKPLAVSLAVEEKTRVILGYEVSVIPASGHLAAISRKKYGHRPNQRPRALHRLLSKIKGQLSDQVHITTDEDKTYPYIIRKVLPNSIHSKYKSKRSAATGQGELKKVYRDPLFSINHTLAMLRANINRLFRRTWCTTKKIEYLHQHLALYMDYHNKVLVNK